MSSTSLAKLFEVHSKLPLTSTIDDVFAYNNMNVYDNLFVQGSLYVLDSLSALNSPFQINNVVEPAKVLSFPAKTNDTQLDSMETFAPASEWNFLLKSVLEYQSIIRGTNGKVCLSFN
jgi:hypothetical protein